MKKGQLVRKRERTEQIIKKTKTPKPSENNENQYSEIPVPPFINKFVQLGITDDERPVKLFFILTKENVSKSKTNFETISWRVSRSDWGGWKTLCIKSEPNGAESREGSSTLVESSRVFLGDVILDSNWLTVIKGFTCWILIGRRQLFGFGWNPTKL